MTAQARLNPRNFGHTFPSSRCRSGRLHQWRTYSETDYGRGAVFYENKAVGCRLWTPDWQRLGNRTLLLPSHQTPPQSHAAAPEGGAIDLGKALSEKQCRHTGSLASVARHRYSVTSGRVTRSQARTRPGRTPASKKLVLYVKKGPFDVPALAQIRRQKGKQLAASPRLAPDKAGQTTPPLLLPADHSGGDKASPLKGTWAAAAARHINLKMRTPTLQETGEKSRHTLQFASLMDN